MLRYTVHRYGLCGGRDPDFRDIFPKTRSASEYVYDLFILKMIRFKFCDSRFEQAGKNHGVQFCKRDSRI